jgi:hypothetical protein
METPSLSTRTHPTGLSSILASASYGRINRRSIFVAAEWPWFGDNGSAAQKSAWAAEICDKKDTGTVPQRGMDI